MQPKHEYKPKYDVFKFLTSLASDLAKMKKVSQLLDAIPKVIYEATGLSRSAILLSQEKPEVMKVESVSNYPDSFLGTIISIDQLNIDKEDLAIGDTVFIDSSSPKINEILRTYLINIKAKRLMITPLSGAFETIGMLIADDPGLQHRFTEDEVSLVNAIAPIKLHQRWKI